jgi:hypothetical protein
MRVRGGMDKLAAANVHSRVRDASCSIAKEQQVAWRQILSFNRRHSAPVCLQASIPRHNNSALSNQHLRKA